MNVIKNAVRTPGSNNRQRFQTVRGLSSILRPLKIALLVITLACILLLAACGPKTAQGKIVGAFQPLRSGMVQMYIEVELDDGTQVDAVLPIDQAIWDKVTNSVRRGQELPVEIQQKAGEDWWEFVRFLEE